MKVLLLEFNEINWRVIDALVAQRGADFLPHFTRLRQQGAWAVQSAVERPPLLDPWITWVTLHTGVPPEVHGASVLEQSSDTITAKRTWHYASEAGKRIGVFGSISAYPPQPLPGFMVPGPFAPGNETHPPALQPVQAINRQHTQAHGGAKAAPGLGDSVRNGAALLGLGLRPRTIGKIARQLLRERSQPHQRWRRVCLQPELNFDVFSTLYRRERPDYATWHSNHAAHFMHHYWRSWDDSAFKAKASPEERAKYGEAVPYGYQLCDELLGRAMAMVEADTVLVVASSMGQQPYVNERFAEGKIVVRIQDMDRVLDLCGHHGITEVVPTMVPQWNLTVPDLARRAELIRFFDGVVRCQGERREPAFSVQETHEQLTVTPLSLAQVREAVDYEFPNADGSIRRLPLRELFVTDTPTVKQGMHHIDGLVAFWGAPVRHGVQLEACTNLDVAPTMLSLMGVPVPAAMTGRVLPVLQGQSEAAASPATPTASAPKAVAA